MENKTVKQLIQFCKDNGIRGYSDKRKADIIELINMHTIQKGEIVIIPKVKEVALERNVFVRESLESYNLPQLKLICRRNKINLHGLSRKNDVIEMINKFKEIHHLNLNIETIDLILEESWKNLSEYYLTVEAMDFLDTTCCNILEYCKRKNNLDLFDIDKYKEKANSAIIEYLTSTWRSDRNILCKLSYITKIKLDIKIIHQYLIKSPSININKYLNINVNEYLKNISDTNGHIISIFISSVFNTFFMELLSKIVIDSVKRTKISVNDIHKIIQTKNKIKYVFDKLDGIYYKHNLPIKLKDINFKFR